MDKFYDAADDATDGMPVKEAPEAVVPSLEDKSKTYGCVFGRACEGDGKWLPAAVYLRIGSGSSGPTAT